MSSGRMAALSGLVACMMILALLPVGSGTLLSPTAGSFVSSSDTDFIKSLTPELPQYLVRHDKGANGDLFDDCFYLVGSASATTLSAGDYRLGGDITNCAEGAFLTSSSTEITQSWAVEEMDGTSGANVLFSSFVKWLELDGIEGFTPGDGVYVDISDPVESGTCDSVGKLSNCDLRLTARTIGSALDFGSIVEAGSNADLTEAGDVDGVLPDTVTFTDFTDAEVNLYFHDANENGASDSGDVMYLRVGRVATLQEVDLTGGNIFAARTPISMDIRMTSGGGGSVGTMVAAGNSDHLPFLQAAPTGAAGKLEVVVGSVGGAGIQDDELWLHWGGTAGTCAFSGKKVQVGDMMLNTVGSHTLGTIATTAAQGVGDALTASSCEGTNTPGFNDLVYAVDLNGNTKFDDGDGLYLHRNTKLGGSTDTVGLTLHDIRLNAFSYGGASYSAGSSVASADKDLVAFPAGKMSLTFVTKWMDANQGSSYSGLRYVADAKVTGGDGTYASPELVYIEDAATVSQGAIRITAISLAEGAALVTGDFDVGRTTAALTNGKVADTGTPNDAYDVGEDVYIDVDTDGTVSTGDIRVTAVGSFAIGSTVACAADSDCTTVLEAPSGWATDNHLHFVATDGDATAFEADEDLVYIAGTTLTAPGTTAVTTYKRISALSHAVESTVDCTAPGLDRDCSTPLTQSLTNAKVTGSDSTFTAGTDQLFVSSNRKIDAGDTRLTAVTLGSFSASFGATVAAGDSDVAPKNVDAGDALYISPAALGGTTTASEIPLRYDVRLIAYPSETIGDMVDTGDQDFTPRFLPAPTINVGRWDAGNTGSINDDGFYATTSAGDANGIDPGDIRLIGILGKLSGSRVTTGEPDDSSSFTDITASVPLASSLKFIDGSSSKRAGAFDSGDLLYVETNGVTSTGSATDLDGFEVRITATTGLSTNYQAGTFVFASHPDATTYSSYGSHPAGSAFQLKFLDHDGDGTYDAPGTDNAKTEHLFIAADDDGCDTTTPCSMIARLGDVFVSGTGGVATTPAPPSGGGSPPASPPATPPTTPPTTPPPSVGVPAPPTPPAPTVPAPTTEAMAEANKAIAASLTVKRSGDNNELSWEDVTGEAGYEVSASDSPFVVVATLAADATSHVHAGNKTTKYIVTAFYSDGAGGFVGKVGALNADGLPDVPGIDEIEPAEVPVKKKAVPAPSLVFLLAGLGIALLVRRQ